MLDPVHLSYATTTITNVSVVRPWPAISAKWSTNLAIKILETKDVSSLDATLKFSYLTSVNTVEPRD